MLLGARPSGVLPNVYRTFSGLLAIAAEAHPRTNVQATAPAQRRRSMGFMAVRPKATCKPTRDGWRALHLCQFLDLFLLDFVRGLLDEAARLPVAAREPEAGDDGGCDVGDRRRPPHAVGAERRVLGEQERERDL